ncbi:hypothetical protein [Vogesella alkaliphila]|uniref:hypothetical protein n=1 Tax=Vogesella alkaliphila TaxID=1193621 RepID=UPI00167BB205|nr:hypothetical protein [Vogesella alkaliphila]
MTPSIEKIEESLEKGHISLHELLVIRSELHSAFKLHPLGFIACTLLNEGARKLRLHYWPTTGGAQQSLDCQIHDHLFNFKSWVLAGAVENIEYEASTAGAEYAVYQASYEANRSILRKTCSTQRLIENTRSIFPSGSSYYVQAGTLHETVRFGNLSSFTVLITTDVSSSAPLVFGPLNGSDRYTYVREELSEESIESKLMSDFGNSSVNP